MLVHMVNPDPVIRFSVSLEPGLHEQLKIEAERNRRSISAQAAICIERDLAMIVEWRRLAEEQQDVNQAELSNGMVIRWNPGMRWGWSE